MISSMNLQLKYKFLRHNKMQSVFEFCQVYVMVSIKVLFFSREPLKSTGALAKSATTSLCVFRPSVLKERWVYSHRFSLVSYLFIYLFICLFSS